MEEGRQMLAAIKGGISGSENIQICFLFEEWHAKKLVRRTILTTAASASFVLLLYNPPKKISHSLFFRE